ncbi:MAG: hypothetical protein GY884_21430, partial [Proteobacteria bacterium]|nr:hypothetical protein [Pseudomonadota bacterium]
DFVYELENGDQYKLTFEGEKLSGKELYYDLKVALFSRYIATLVQALLASERFASLAKALPFHILIRSADYRDHAWLSQLITIDDATFADSPLASVFRASVPPTDAPTLAQQFAFLSGYVDQPDAAEHAQLTALVAEHPELFDATLTRLDQALDQGRAKLVAHLSRFLWTVVDRYPEPVLATQKRLLATALPSLEPPEEDPGRGPRRRRPRRKPAMLELVQERLGDHLGMLRAVRTGTPDHPFADQVA